MSLLRAAIVGLGSVAPMHRKSLETLGIPIKAVCDIRPHIVAKWEKEFSCQGFEHYEEMLKAGGFEVLHNCLPHYLHAPVSVAALERGFHVLCEKPMAIDVAQGESMIAASKESGASLGVIFQNRYGPGAKLIKKTLDSGELGAVQGGWLRVTWNRGDSYYAGSDWRGTLKGSGGGVLINQSIHSFDLMNFFLGNPTDVDASVSNRVHPDIEVEDVAEGIITYGKAPDAIPVSFFVNTYHPYDAPASLEIVCENGRASLVGETAVITMDNGTEKTAGPDKEAQHRFGMKTYWGVSHVKQIQCFYDSVAKGLPPEVSGVEAIVTQRLINKIYESVRRES